MDVSHLFSLAQELEGEGERTLKLLQKLRGGRDEDIQTDRHTHTHIKKGRRRRGRRSGSVSVYDSEEEREEGR